MDPKPILPHLDMAIWMPLLGGGIGVRTPLGITLRQFLCEQIKIPATYLEQRIQTILFNNHPVDNVDQLTMSNGDVVALSAAMPGLAGATLRRGGHLAAMRASISQTKSGSGNAALQEGIVTIKLFNMVAKEMGPQVLSGEVWVKSDDLMYLRRKKACIRDSGKEIPDLNWIGIHLENRQVAAD